MAFVCHFVAVGFFFYSYGVFFKSVAAELGGTRLQVSLGLSIAQVTSALVAPLIGRAVEHGTRRVIVCGALACTAGFALMTQVSALWQFYAVLATLVGAGVVAMGGISPSALVTSWFVTRRGMALGIATIGVSASGLVMPGVATKLIDAIGWRGSFGVYAAVTAILVIPAALLVVIEGPGSSIEAAAPRHGTKALMKSRAFWSIAISQALILFSVGAVLTHLVPLLTDAGINALDAATMLSTAAALGIAGKFAFGALTDRTDVRHAVWLSIAIQLAGVILLASGQLWPAVCVYGFGMGGVVPLHSMLVASRFGSMSYARAVGLMRPFMLPIASAGIPLAGYLFDRHQNYDIALITFAVAFVLAAIAVAFVPPQPFLETSPARA